MSKLCEPVGFDGYCGEHHIPVEKCWENESVSEVSSTNREELKECFACHQQKHVNEHWLCNECKNEVREVNDTWLVQEFSKWYSQDEVTEAIEQMRVALQIDARIKAEFLPRSTVEEAIGSNFTNWGELETDEQAIESRLNGYKDKLRKDLGL